MRTDFNSPQNDFFAPIEDEMRALLEAGLRQDRMKADARMIAEYQKLRKRHKRLSRVFAVTLGVTGACPPAAPFAFLAAVFHGKSGHELKKAGERIDARVAQALDVPFYKI